MKKYTSSFDLEFVQMADDTAENEAKFPAIWTILILVYKNLILVFNYLVL